MDTSDKSSPNTSEVNLAPGDFLIREKTPCDGLYIVKEGQLEVYKTAGNGNKIPLGMVSSGQYVGETALLMGTGNSSNVVALTAVKAVKLSKSSIEAQLKSAPTWLVALTKGLIARLHNANDLLRRNEFVDESLSSQVKAVGAKSKKAS